jgi:hypothetical protein
MTVHESSHVWTPEMLKQYVDQRFLDSDKAITAALQAAEKAVDKAEVATEKRFDALSDDADRRSQELSDKISVLQESVNYGGGVTTGTDKHRALLTQNIYALGALGGFATAIITLVITHH